VRRETDSGRWEVAQRPSPAPLGRHLVRGPGGFTQHRGPQPSLREVPFPGVPIVLNFGAAWDVEHPGGPAQRHNSFVAGLHTVPAVVCNKAASWSCLELRLTPIAAHRLLRVAMHELTNATVELDDLLPGVRELNARLHEARSWAERFDLVDSFLLRALSDGVSVSPGVEWSWQLLVRTHGSLSIGALARELGWSHRRFIARFREQVGLTPKAAARVIRFDYAASALRSAPARPLAELAVTCGYSDQAHLNRDFRELAGTTPTAFVAACLESGAVAA
jgi:AraC-like DNA-binding protein